MRKLSEIPHLRRLKTLGDLAIQKNDPWNENASTVNR